MFKQKDSTFYLRPMHIVTLLPFFYVFVVVGSLLMRMHAEQVHTHATMAVMSSAKMVTNDDESVHWHICFHFDTPPVKTKDADDSGDWCCVSHWRELKIGSKYIVARGADRRKCQIISSHIFGTDIACTLQICTWLFFISILTGVKMWLF